MNFLLVFLISVLPLTLTQSPKSQKPHFYINFGRDRGRLSPIPILPNHTMERKDLTSLENFGVGNKEFSLIDKNKNKIMERTEFRSYFDTFKESPNDTDVTEELFATRMASKGLVGAAAGRYLYRRYDCVKDGVFNVTDFDEFYNIFDLDKNRNVSHDEFITIYHDLIKQAKLSN